MKEHLPFYREFTKLCIWILLTVLFDLETEATLEDSAFEFERTDLQYGLLYQVVVACA